MLLAPGFTSRHRTVRIALLVLGLAALCFAPSAARPSAPARSSTPGSRSPSEGFLPASRLRPGMKGYGLTVFRGTKIERFPITVLGVLRSYIADSDLILIRIDGGYPAQHGVGIVAGMSGSPVYVEGRLIGAVAYGWPFSKEPIGGVTPIANMLRDLPPARAASPSTGDPGRDAASPPPAPDAGTGAVTASARPGIRALPHPIRVADRTLTRIQVLPTAPAGGSHPPADTLVLTPVSTLLQLRGFGPRASADLGRLLRPLNLETVRTQASAAPAGVHAVPAVQPGAALGVQLLAGDLEISGTGTLTYVDATRFLGFGHPMAQLGSVSLPATLSCVHDILPSYQRPFKFASPVRPLGELATDRLWAVGGYLGRTAPTVPVTIRRVDPVEGRDQTYRLRATASRFLAPPIIGQALVQALGSDSPSALESGLRVHYRIRPHGKAPIEGEQIFSGSGVETVAATQVSTMLGHLTNNEFEHLRLDGVDIEARVLHGNHTATVQKVYTERSRYGRGEALDVHVVLKPAGKPSVEKVARFRVPPDLAKGPLVVGVSGGGEIVGLRKRLQLPTPEVENLDQLLRTLAETEKNQELVVRVLLPTQGAVVGGERLHFLPESLRDLLPGLTSAGVGSERDFLEVRIPTPWLLRGVEGAQVDLAGAAPATPAWESPSPPRPTDGQVALAPGAPHPAAAGIQGSGDGARPTSSAVPAPGPSPARIAPPAPAYGPAFRPSAATTRQIPPAGTRRWDVKDAASFGRGSFDGTTLSRSGEVGLAPSVRGLVDSAGRLVWSLACTPDGTVWAGCAEEGRVQAVIWPSGRPRPGFQVHDGAVTALASGAGDTLMIGTAPHARLYRRTKAGEIRDIALARDGYVWDILPRPDGSTLVATGAPAVLYRVDPAGAVHVVHRFTEQHLRALAATPQGEIIAGTAGPGGVYRVGASLGSPEPLFSTRFSSVDAVAVGPSGEIGAASGRDLYRLAPGKPLRITPVSDHPLLGLLADDDGSFVAGGSAGRVYRVDAAGAVTRLASTEGGPVLALRRAGRDILAGTGRPGGVVALSPAPSASGTWTSDVLDAGSPARWGRIRWQQGQGRAGSVAIETRSGFTPAPDASWSPWSSALTVSDGQGVTSPVGRYMQVRARLSGGEGTPAPTLASLSLYYRNQDEAPTLAVEHPAAGELAAGTFKIAWTASGVGSEFLAYDLLSARDGGPWTPISLGLPPRLKEHPPADADPAPAPQANEHAWDTRRVPDGRYQIKVVARPQGRPDEMRAEAVSAVFTIANSRPEITVTRRERLAGTAGVRIHGVAKSHIAWVSSISWRQGRQEWQVAEPDDGVLDSDREAFSLVVREGPEVEIRVTDEAGNMNTIRVPARP